LVSVTLLPALASRLFKSGDDGAPKMRRLPVIDDFAAVFARGAAQATALLVRKKALGGAAVLGVAALAGIATVTLAPPLDYLPNGNRNLLIGRIIPPPGYNLATVEASAKKLEDAVRPLWNLPDRKEPAPEGAPLIERFFFVALRNIAIVGAVATEPGRVSELLPILSGPVRAEPGTFGGMSQRSIFGRGLGGSRAIDVDISGPELETLIPTAQRVFGLISQVLPRSEGTQYRPQPGLNFGQPEVRLTPDRLRLADVGVSASDFGRTIDAFNDGLRVSEITVDGQRIDLMLTGDGFGVGRTQDVGALPVVTAQGEILPASLLAEIDVTFGPVSIRRIDGSRTITLTVTPAGQYPLEEAVQKIEEALAPLRAEGLPPGVTLRLAGAVDELQTAWNAMVWDLLLAVVIVYLVMAVLFESFAYPLVVLVTVPLAAMGGIVGLGVLNLFVDQKLDMLTLLGFVILIGIVVNNAILLVDQSLAHMRRGGLAPDDAIRAAARDRLRPIFMSTLTSVFGMAPLVLFPGAGAELYRGLGSVVVGGLAFSAVLTLAATPPLTSIAAALVERKRESRVQVPKLLNQ
ncbi:MAG: efflux RND transporter permease subunit, partial [Pseudomonadota bacterium]